MSADAPYIRIATENGELRASGPTTCALGHRLGETGHGCDGVFAGWTFDGSRLVVEGDRYGMYPLFIYRSPDEIAVSPSLTKLLELGAARDLDLDALAVFLHIGFFLRDETPFLRIRALPPGGRIRWTRDECVAEGAPFLTSPNPIERKRAIDEYVELFRQAVRRRPPRGRIAMPISGGRDSRHILFELVAAGRKPDACVTARYFPPRTDGDAIVAARVAAAVGVSHVLLEQGDELAAESRKNLATGFCTDEHAWYLVVADFLARNAETTYDGIAGDVLSAGLFLTPDRLAKQAAGDYRGLAKDFLSPRAAVTLSRVLSPVLRKRLSRKHALERVAEELAAHANAANPIGSFCFWNRTRREIALAPYGLGPAEATVYAPYLDHELYDFLASLPAEMLVDRRFHTDAITRAFPQHAGLGFAAAAEYGKARSPDRSFTASLLQSQWGRGRNATELLAGGLDRRLRVWDALDGLRTERARLQPRIALYLRQLEDAAHG